jgi:hypothetical protein
MRYPKNNSLAWQAMKQGHGIRAEAVHQHPEIYVHLRRYAR